MRRRGGDNNENDANMARDDTLNAQNNPVIARPMPAMPMPAMPMPAMHDETNARDDMERRAEALRNSQTRPIPVTPALQRYYDMTAQQRNTAAAMPAAAAAMPDPDEDDDDIYD